jgi:hypothetical protein
MVGTTTSPFLWGLTLLAVIKAFYVVDCKYFLSSFLRRFTFDGTLLPHGSNDGPTKPLTLHIETQIVPFSNLGNGVCVVGDLYS